MSKFNPVGGGEYRLSSSIGSTDSTILLSSFIEPVTGTPFTMANMNTDFAFGTLDPKTSQSEFVMFTGVTQNADGSALLTGVIRGLAKKYPFTTDPTYKLPHSGTSVFILSDAPQLFNQYPSAAADVVITGQWTFTQSIVGPTNPAATTSVLGLTKMSAAPAVAGQPIALEQNDSRVAAMAGSQGVPATGNPFVTKDNIYDSNTDQVQSTQNGTVEFGMANSSTNKNKINQSFIPVKTKTRGVLLYKSADAGTFTGTITVALYADSAGSPTGSALATQTLTNAQWLALPVGEFEVDYSAEYSMVAGTSYWIQISSSTADNSNHPNLGTSTSGGYANGSVKYWNTTDGYVAVSNIDLYFKTLEGVVGQIGMSSQQQVFTTIGANTWTKPTGARMVQIQMIGGGGGGGGSAANYVTSGGGGGEVTNITLPASMFSSTVTVTIGDGGNGGTGGVGNNGSDTSFGSYVVAKGGGAGGINNSTPPEAYTGFLSTLIAGFPGNSSKNGNLVTAAGGANSGGSTPTQTHGTPTINVAIGGNGGATGTTGAVGGLYGGGGGGSTPGSNQTGGKGGQGIAVITTHF